jgi:hypothetical protein
MLISHVVLLYFGSVVLVPVYLQLEHVHVAYTVSVVNHLASYITASLRYTLPMGDDQHSQRKNSVS